jgi:hypothetical protein
MNEQASITLIILVTALNTGGNMKQEKLGNFTSDVGLVVVFAHE